MKKFKIALVAGMALLALSVLGADSAQAQVFGRRPVVGVGARVVGRTVTAPRRVVAPIAPVRRVVTAPVRVVPPAARVVGTTARVATAPVRVVTPPYRPVVAYPAPYVPAPVVTYPTPVVHAQFGGSVYFRY